MKTALLLIVLVAAVASWAGPSTHTEPTADLTFTPLAPHASPPGDVVAFWSQAYWSGGQGWSSEYRAYPLYDCESADDFYSTTGDTIVMVEWWGNDQTLSGISEFLLRFCEDDTTGPWHLPGNVIYEQQILDFTEEYVDVVCDKYTCDVPGGFAPTPGQTYWVSILGIHSGAHGGHQWYWYECPAEDYWGAGAAMKSVFWSNPEWTPWSDSSVGGRYVELAFVLYSLGDTPVEDKSWAQIKAMFR